MQFFFVAPYDPAKESIAPNRILSKAGGSWRRLHKSTQIEVVPENKHTKYRFGTFQIENQKGSTAATSTKKSNSKQKM